MASFEETLPQPVEDFMLIGSFGEVIVTPQSDIPEKDRPSQLFTHCFAQMPTRKKTSKKRNRLQAAGRTPVLLQEKPADAFYGFCCLTLNFV